MEISITRQRVHTVFAATSSWYGFKSWLNFEAQLLHWVINFGIFFSKYHSFKHLSIFCIFWNEVFTTRVSFVLTLQFCSTPMWTVFRRVWPHSSSNTIVFYLMNTCLRSRLLDHDMTYIFRLPARVTSFSLHARFMLSSLTVHSVYMSHIKYNDKSNSKLNWTEECRCCTGS